MSSLGWTGSTLSNQLVSANPRQVGFTNRGWLLLEATGSLISSQTSFSNKDIIGKSGSDLCRSFRVIVQEYNNRDKGITRPICFSTSSGREKGWGAETSDQPEGDDSICEGQTFQDGRCTLSIRSDPSRGLNGKTRFERCQVPIHPDHQKYLVFLWDSKFCRFTYLPFDLSATPRAFLSYSKPIQIF